MNWNKKNVLITGMTGFLAPHIARTLLNNNTNIHIVGCIHDSKKNSFCKMEGIDQRISIAVVDINVIDRIKEVIANYEINYIFHCAANSIIKSCVKDPVGAFKTNIIGTANVLEAARQIGGVDGIMCMESDKSYGSFKKNDLPYLEEHPIKPMNVYEISKACSGLVANAYSNNYGIPVFTIRAANLYGPGDTNLSRIIPGSILRILNGGSPVLYSGVAGYVREFLYIEDASQAIVKLMEKIDISKSNVFNIGSNSVHRIDEIMDIIVGKFPSKIKVKIENKDPLYKEIEEQYLDYSKLMKIIPEYSPRSILEGLDPTIKWYTTHFNSMPIPS